MTVKVLLGEYRSLYFCLFPPNPSLLPLTRVITKMHFKILHPVSSSHLLIVHHKGQLYLARLILLLTVSKTEDKLNRIFLSFPFFLGWGWV